MLLFMSMLFLIQTAVVSADIVKRPNGYFITGRGCGVSNPIRYLNSMPKDIENYECSFIDLQKSRPLRAELQPKDGENVGAGGGGSSACSAPDSNCPCNWIGDQICDDVCNVAAHNFDNGDCADDYAGPEYGGVGDGEEESGGDCPDDWIGDLICDDECNVAAHNFDNGDCCLPADEIDTSMCEACECLQ